MRPIFITGTGTGVGKTLVSAILVEALKADYWKPVQAGFADGTDSGWVQSMIGNEQSRIIPEAYKVSMAASPHIAARAEGATISLSTIMEFYSVIRTQNPLIIEGAGGLMVPLNERQFVADLIKALDARVILVSRNYLGSINHSLLTAAACAEKKLDVAGWIFNDQYLDYEREIASWTGYSILASIPRADHVTKEFIAAQAARIRPDLNNLL